MNKKEDHFQINCMAQWFKMLLLTHFHLSVGPGSKPRGGALSCFRCAIFDGGSIYNTRPWKKLTPCTLKEARNTLLCSVIVFEICHTWLVAKLS